MYQQQQYQMSNYRGNQPGHDQYLRADSNQPSSFGMQASATSQYRGFQKQFQPTGMVQSFYRGNQPGHDQYLRADSTQPSNIHLQQQQQQQQQQQSFNSAIGNSQQFSQSSAGAASYQMSNYRGNQPGHDQYLRADATQPSNIQGSQGSAYTSSTTSAPVQGRSFGL